MEDPEAGQVADLHPAPFTIREDDIGPHPVDRLREVLPDLLGEGEFLLLETVQASQAAARAKVLRDNPSYYFEGVMGESGIAWYIYHRESLPADLLPGLMVGWAW